MKPYTFIIAEAGVNHNGELHLAKKLIDGAVDAGADAVKFQTFKAARLVCEHASQAEYQKVNTGEKTTQLEMLRNYELAEESHRTLIAYARQKGILFLSSPFDFESIDLLDRLGLKILKIPSGEINNLPYLRKIGGLGKELILSSGMADLGEIEDALDVLEDSGTPLERITVLHCNTEYPTPFEDVNLMAIRTIAEAFRVKVGYSDHTLGLEVPIAAVALGAEVIEKHLTLDQDMEGPDHKASMEPHDFKKMVRAIRNIERALGDGIKKQVFTKSGESRQKKISFFLKVSSFIR